MEEYDGQYVELHESEGKDLFFPGIRHGAFDALAARVPFEAVLRFELVDGKNRTFAVHRRCWIGGESDWLFLGEGTLSAMLKKYVVHIEQESFYDLL